MQAFSRLHDVVPTELGRTSPVDEDGRKSKRVSKVTTLRRAINYIKHLQRALSTDQWISTLNINQIHLYSTLKSVQYH